jgi:SAM-dependent MidA family methyltransferase
MPIQNDKLKESFFTVLGNRDAMPLDDFIEWALYDTEIGYYQKKQKRVGKDKKNDFYTSASLSKPLWGKLLVESCISLLGDRNPEDFSFVEIGAEPESNSLANEEHPFKEIKTIRLGKELEIPPKAIVFSNEWLDAQPFKRFRFDKESKLWHEIGVSLESENWTEQKLLKPELTSEITKTFPIDYVVSYTIDWPTGAERILKNLLMLNWDGLFLTFDYGLNFQRICFDFPDGTGRAYQNHKMNKDFLNTPGGQDITCHICWDTIQETLVEHQFTNINLLNQESFFINHGSKVIKPIIENASSNDELLGSLKELIHPFHMGQKFQVMYGGRGI